MAKIRNQVTRVGKEALRDYSKRRRVPKRVLAEMGNTLREEMIDTIKRGVSPIEGDGRFPAYKNPSRYPDKVRDLFPNKRRRPVNLRLSGRFWDALTYKITGDSRLQFGRRSGPSIEVGFYDRTNFLKERGHREGANGQPRRPIIPARGEAFSRRIVRKVRDRLIRFLNT